MRAQSGFMLKKCNNSFGCNLKKLPNLFKTIINFNRNYICKEIKTNKSGIISNNINLSHVKFLNNQETKLNQYCIRKSNNKLKQKNILLLEMQRVIRDLF